MRYPLRSCIAVVCLMAVVYSGIAFGDSYKSYSKTKSRSFSSGTRTSSCPSCQIPQVMMAPSYSYVQSAPAYTTSRVYVQRPVKMKRVKVKTYYYPVQAQPQVASAVPRNRAIIEPAAKPRSSGGVCPTCGKPW